MIKIQLLDDEPHVLGALQRILRPRHWEIHAFTDVQQALDALTVHDYAVIVSDYKMPLFDGVTYLQFAKQRQPDALRLLLSAHADRQAMMKAINCAEVYRFLPKPWDDYEIDAALCAAVELYLLRGENQRLLKKLSEHQTALQRQQALLLMLEAEHPGITQVTRDAEGAVLIDHEGLYDHV